MFMLLSRFFQRETINTGPKDRGPKDQRTQGPGTKGPEDPIKARGHDDLSVLHLAFMTEMQLVSINVLSSNILLYHCES